MAEERKRELAVPGERAPARREPARERGLLRGAFRAAGQAAGVAVRTGQGITVRTAQWAAGTALEAGRQVVDTVVGSAEPERPDPVVRQLISYVPTAAGSGESAARSRRSTSVAELRQRGDALLAQSADVYHTEEFHPAFDHILDELAPDEARMLRFLFQNGPQPSVDVRTNRPLGIGSELVATDLTSVPEQAGIRHLDRASAYLVNLKRLGLMAISDDPVVLSRYMVLEVQPNVDAAVKRAGRSPKVIHKSLVLTDFGRDFCATCFTVDSRFGGGG